MDFDFNKKYILQNEVVLLRPLQQTDIESLARFSLNESELWKYSLYPANGLVNLKKYIERALKARKLKDSYPFLVIDKRQNKTAGSTRFYDMQPANKSVQLGYTWYGNEFQGTAVNKNCKYLMLQFAFETLEYERVEFRADARNQRSIAAMKSIGCVEEGILRSHLPISDGRRDSIVLSILREEWFKTVKPLLLQKIGANIL